MRIVTIGSSLLLLLATTAVAAQTKIQVARRAVLIATIDATCDACDWSIEGREAIMLVVSVDGKYSQHVPLVRTGRADYPVLVGTVEPGMHVITVAVDAERSSRDLRTASPPLAITNVRAVLEGDPDYLPLSLVPFLHERPNTAGRFTDVPVFMWYEVEPATRGTRYRYSVIFTNEDGGTPADRLMATWGRTTDIEYVYSVEVDKAGTILDEDYQGPKHEILKYQGLREGRHPLLWVVTDNNMVLDRGSATVRYAPAPVRRPLLSEANETREEVMDTNRWLYAVMVKELERERKIVANAPPGKGVIPTDPRQYVYLDACARVGDNALAFSILVGDDWIPSDRGVTEYRVVRDGCFRAAAPLPQGMNPTSVQAIRLQAYERPDRVAKSPVRVERITSVFYLTPDFLRIAPLKWNGPIELRANGPALELAFK